MPDVEPMTDEWFNQYYEKPEAAWGSLDYKATCKTCFVDIPVSVKKLRGHVDWHEGFGV